VRQGVVAAEHNVEKPQNLAAQRAKVRNAKRNLHIECLGFGFRTLDRLRADICSVGI
jgi:hypothetical protein